MCVCVCIINIMPNIQHLLVRVKESTGKRRLWTRPNFFSIVLHDLYVFFEWF